MLFSFEEREEAVAKYRALNGQGNNAYILCDDETFRLIGVEKVLNLGESAEEIASNLYLKLREGEKIAQTIIAIAPREQSGIMAGVMNRLAKACKGQ